MQLRGGSSKGLFFLSKDLPEDVEAIKRTVLLAMEGITEGDPRQIDGLGGAHSLTSTAAIVGPSMHPDADVDYLFVQFFHQSFLENLQILVIKKVQKKDCKIL